MAKIKKAATVKAKRAYNKKAKLTDHPMIDADGNDLSKLFAFEKDGPPMPSGWTSSSKYKPAIEKLLNDMEHKKGVPFLLPKSMKSTFMKTHKDGDYGYSFRWQLIEPDKKIYRGWRIS